MNIIKCFSVAALAVAIFGCNKQDGASFSDQSQRLVASYGQVEQTKVDLAENIDGGLTLSWADGDSFDISTEAGDYVTTFEYVAATSETTATFKNTGTALESGTLYVATYPSKNMVGEYEPIMYQNGNGVYDHLVHSFKMTSSFTFSDNGSLSFSHTKALLSLSFFGTNTSTDYRAGVVEVVVGVGDGAKKHQIMTRGYGIPSSSNPAKINLVVDPKEADVPIKIVVHTPLASYSYSIAETSEWVAGKQYDGVIAEGFGSSQPWVSDSSTAIDLQSSTSFTSLPDDDILVLHFSSNPSGFAFNKCSRLADFRAALKLPPVTDKPFAVYIQRVTTIGNICPFANLKKLTYFAGPKLISFGTANMKSGPFQSCAALKVVDAPSITSIR